MKSVMVTGATTPLGAAIVEQIIKDKRAHTVLAVGAEPYEDVRGLFPDSAVVYLQADLTHTRELRNLLERALIESGGEPIEPRHLHFLQRPRLPAMWTLKKWASFLVVSIVSMILLSKKKK